MPINDSAGVGVYLIDKSQRATTTVGFRSAAAIEADRGLCETPTLISSAKDYVNVFGTPKMDKHGKGSLEAFMLAQNNVPQVLTRAKKPTMKASDRPFGCIIFAKEGDTIGMTNNPASGIATPTAGSTCNLYAKGEGTYFGKDSNNVVLRFSKPTSYSAYSKAERVVQLDVFDFDGVSHIDEDKIGAFLPVKDLSGILDDNGNLKVPGSTFKFDGSQGTGTFKVTAFVNGRVNSPAAQNISVLHTKPSDDPNDYVAGLYDWIAYVARNVEGSNGQDIIKGDIPFVYCPRDIEGGEDTSLAFMLDSRSNGSGSGEVLGQQVNCFNLSVSFSVEADLTLPSGQTASDGFYAFPCGSVTITGDRVKYVLSSSMFLANKGEYMFMGEQNSYWATYYNTYLKESFVFSFSYDDYDANYNSIQADARLASSNYLVSKSAETFEDYAISENDDLIKNLQYFNSTGLADNDISMGNKSYAYSTALTGLLTDNLTRWRCLTAPNLGDIMSSGDYTAAIQAANEVTLGLSNIGQAASVDFFHNTDGRHGNRFISDFSQYVYRTLNGKRTAVTAASLVTALLNQHYNDGIEARPPFGYTYGQIAGLGLSQVFTGPERAEVARVYKVNPIIEDGGLFLWDERTSQLTETSLSDTHSIISFLWMKFALYDSMKSFVAEYNDQSTVNRGLSVLRSLHAYFVSRNYIEADSADLAVTAENNVLGSEVLRFDFRVRFKGVARYVDIFVTAYSQTQTLEVSLGQEA